MNYSGPLLDLLDPGPQIVDLDQLPPCGGGVMHHHAASNAIFAITCGRFVRLTRRIATASYDEAPGTVEGYVRGMSTSGEGRITLGLEGPDGQSFGVDVSNPQLWHWEVTDGI